MCLPGACVCSTPSSHTDLEPTSFRIHCFVGGMEIVLRSLNGKNCSYVCVCGCGRTSSLCSRLAKLLYPSVACGMRGSNISHVIHGPLLLLFLYLLRLSRHDSQCSNLFPWPTFDPTEVYVYVLESLIASPFCLE